MKNVRLHPIFNFHLWRGISRQRSQRGAFSTFLRVRGRRDAAPLTNIVELFITFLLMLHLRGIDITLVDKNVLTVCGQTPVSK